MKLREPRCDCEYDWLARRLAKLEGQLFAATEHIRALEAAGARLREKNAQLREGNARLQRQLAGAAMSTPCRLPQASRKCRKGASRER